MSAVMPPMPEVGGAAPQQLPMAQPPEPDWARIDDEARVRDIALSDEERQRICKKINAEIVRSIEGLRSKYDRIHDYGKRYREERKDKRDGAFKEGSNVSVPLTAPDTDQVVARTCRVLFATDPLFMAEPAHDQEIPLDELYDVQAYMRAKVTDPYMEFKRSIREVIHGCAVTGTGIAKVKWETRSRMVCRYEMSNEAPRLDGGGAVMSKPVEVESDDVYYEGNIFEPVKRTDFFYPPEYDDDPNLIDTSQWVAHRFLERVGEMRKKAAKGRYDKDAVERIASQDDRTSARGDISALNRDSFETVGMVGDDSADSRQITCFEVHYRMSIKDKKGKAQPERECIFVYAHAGETGEIVSAKYNFFFHGRRPFVRIPFNEQGCFDGRGMVQRLWYTQTVMNDLVNMGIDAGQLSLMRPIVKRKDQIIGRGKQDDLAPGRVFEVDDVDQFKVLDIGDTSASTFQWLELFKAFGQKAGGITDFLVGMEGERGNRESAAGAGQRTGNSSPFFDLFLDSVREGLEQAADLMFWNCYQFHPDDDAYTVNTGGDFVKKLFKMPIDAGGRYRFKITASSVASNPEVRKQTVQHLMGLLDPAEQQLMQVAAQVGDPNTPPLIRELLDYSARRKTTQLKQIAETFEIPGSMKLVPDWDQIRAKMEPEMKQAAEAAKNQPPHIEEPIVRAMFGHWDIFEPEIKAQVYQSIGLQVPPEIQQRIAIRQQQQPQGDMSGNPQPEGAMGEAGQSGGAGPTAPPPGM